MRKLIMKMSVSLDGFVSNANGANDWIFKTGDEKSLAWSVGKVEEAGLIIVGRKTFEAMASYWPTATGPFATPMNGIPKVVFSKKGFTWFDSNIEQLPSAATWVGAQILYGNLADEIVRLKAQDGQPIVALGGATFMRSLIATGLIDEYHLAIHPVVLGSGMSIFTDVELPLYLKLMEVKAFPGGTVVHAYTHDSIQ